MTTPKHVSGTDIDRAMLQSMATSLRSGIDFSFNRHDMAELLDRLAAIQPDPEPQPVDVRHEEGCNLLGGKGGRLVISGLGCTCTPPIAGTVSVEAAEAFKPFFGEPVMEGILWSDATPESLVTIRVQKRVYDRARAALRALAGEDEA